MTDSALQVDINSDMGEGFGAYRLGDDAAILDIVTSANVACGFHGGDPVMMAWTDWMYTGNTESLARCYEALKAKKTLEFCAREKDGLLVSGGMDAPKEGGLREPAMSIPMPTIRKLIVN